MTAVAAATPEVLPPPPPPLLLFITDCRTAKTVWVEISTKDNIKMLKFYVFRKSGVPIEDQILIFQGEELFDELTIQDCPMNEKANVLHLLNKKEAPSQVSKHENDKEDKAA